MVFVLNMNFGFNPTARFDFSLDNDKPIIAYKSESNVSEQMSSPGPYISKIKYLVYNRDYI